MKEPRSTEKPFEASFANSDRYTPPKSSGDPCSVVVEGSVCEGFVIGRNGPRTHVRFRRDGDTYVRWFDSADVLLDPADGSNDAA